MTATQPARTTVSVTPQRIVVEHLTLDDPQLADFVERTAECDRATTVERALRIGLLTLCNAGVSMSADVVKAEFERLYDRIEARETKAAETLAATLRDHFADGDGRLPQTLERFLGDQGSLRRLTHDLFDETKRESALGRLNELLGRYFDGDGSRLATLLDPTRSGSPLHQFRTEVSDEFRRLSERIAELEAGSRARAEERAKGTAKGVDFEDALEEALGALARGAGDLVDRTGTEAGDALRSKKGDFVVGIDPSRTRGVDLRIVVEAKDRTVSMRRFAAELAESRENRRAAVALAVFTPVSAPSGVAPLTVIGSDVYCVFDPEADDAVALEAAFRLARALALLTLRDASVSLDVPAVQGALDEIRRMVGEVQGAKVRLTGIATAAGEVSRVLDSMRAGVIRAVTDIETQLSVIDDGSPVEAQSA
jgi:hypothetical protein